MILFSEIFRIGFQMVLSISEKSSLFRNDDHVNSEEIWEYKKGKVVFPLSQNITYIHDRREKIIQKTPLFKKNAHVTYEIKKYHIESA